jgi:anti-sigma factor RsiW
MSWSHVALSRYVDGDLPPEQRAAVERHLAACADCSTIVAEYRAIGAAVVHARAFAPLRPLPLPRDSPRRLAGWGTRVLVVFASAAALFVLFLCISLVVDRASTLRSPTRTGVWPGTGDYAVYVALEGDNAVARVDPRGRVERRKLSGAPWALALGTDGVVAGVVAPSGGAIETTGGRVSRITLPLETVAAMAIGQRARYVSGAPQLSGRPEESTGRGEVIALDSTSGAVLWRHSGYASPPPSLGILPSGVLAVVNPAGSVELLDPATGSALQLITIQGPVDPVASCLAVAPSSQGQAVYLVNAGLYTVDVLEGSDLHVTRTWHLAPTGAAGWLPRSPRVHASAYSQTSCQLSRDGALLHFASSRSPFGDQLLAVRTADGQVISKLSAPSGGFGGIALAPDGRWLFASGFGTGDLLVVDLTSFTLTGAVHVGEQPRSVVIANTP